jgi:hypothetical protein
MEVELQPFDVPSKVYLKIPAQYTGIRSPSMNVAPFIPLSEVPVEDLNKLCEDFRISVFKAAGKHDNSYRAYN